MNNNIIEIEVSLEDYKKIMNLDEFDIERKILQTSACQYIRISLQPERTNPEASKLVKYPIPKEVINMFGRCDVPNSENK